MKKTPITDKIKKYLQVVEALTLANPLDTGMASSNYTKNWTQASSDFDKALGLDDLKQALGQKDSDVLNVSTPRFGTDKNKETSASMSYKIFEGVRQTKLSLLEVAKNTNTTEESKNPYIWKSNQFSAEVLNEETTAEPSILTPAATTVGTKDSTFWRSSRSGSIFVKRFSFDGYYYALAPVLAPGNTYKGYMHSGRGVTPSAVTGAGGILSNHVHTTFIPYLVGAVEQLKNFVTDDEEATEFLTKLAQINNFFDLPVFVQDSIMLGVLEAANTKIVTTTKEGGSIPVAPQGVGLLLPTPQVLNTLQGLVGSLGLNEAYLTEALKADITSNLQSFAGSAPLTYTDNFKKDLFQSIGVKKYNLTKSLTSCTTTLYSVIAQSVNVVSRLMGATADPKTSPEFFFRQLGYNKTRSTDIKTMLGNALIDANCPICVLRGIKPDATTPFRYESFFVDLKSNGASFSTPNTEKSVSLPTATHNYILGQVPTTITSLVDRKKAYIDAFGSIQTNAYAIQGADLGKRFFEQILQTCYNGDGTFLEGVFFVGLSPLFWDEGILGTKILVNTDVDLSQVVQGYNADNTQNGALINSAAGLYFNTKKDYTGAGFSGEGDSKRVTDMTLVKERHSDVLAKYPFKTLSEAREDILKELYAMETGQQDLAEVATKRVWKILKNIQNGFWTMEVPELEDGKLLAAFNPFDTNSSKKKRFFKDIKNPQVIKQLQEQEKAKYAKS